MKVRSEKGFTGIDISVSVIIAFIFVTIIAMLIYRVNSTSREIYLKSDATYLAINEIEQVKSDGIEAYLGKGNNTVVGTENQEVSGFEGFYKTITVQDYADGKTGIISDVVKRVTVKISYMFQGKQQTVKLSTILSKES